MASPEVHDRRVDLGAAYFTVKEPDFEAVVKAWESQSLVRRWTDTFDVFGADGHSTTSGPMRYAAVGGLRSLVRAAAAQNVRTGSVVTVLADLDHDAVVLAMPDPQAARLAPDAAGEVAYDPVIAVAAGWPQRCWPFAAAAFINDDPDIAFVADDGSRRGDDAAVLVVHTTAPTARAHLQDPEQAVPAVLSALHRVLGISDAPQWTHVHRWTFAKPADTHGDRPFGLSTEGGRPLGRCGDSWCPSGAPRVESAWLSGRRLGHALAEQL